MSSLKIYCRAKAAEFRERVWQDYEPAHDSDVVFVYPTSAQARAQRLTRSKQKGVLYGSVILALRDFEDLFLAGHGMRLLSTDELPLVIRLLQRDPALQESLTKYLPNVRAPNASEGGERLSTELDVPLAHGVLHRLAEELEVIAPSLGRGLDRTEPARAYSEELRDFAKSFFQLIKTKGWVYRELALAELWQTENPWQPLSDKVCVRHLIFDGFWQLSPFLWSMLKWFERASLSGTNDPAAPEFIHFLFDYSPSAESERFPHLAELWAELAPKCSSRNLPCGSTLQNRTTGECVQENVLCDDPTCLSATSSKSTVFANSVADREEEVRLLATRLREQLDQGGALQLEDVAVCVPSLSEYAGIIRTIFREEGIPYRLPFTLPLTSTPIWEFLEVCARLVKRSASSEVLLADLDALVSHPWFAMVYGRTKWSSFEYRIARNRFSDATTLGELIQQVEESLRGNKALVPEGDEETNGADSFASDEASSKKTERLKKLAAVLRSIEQEVKRYQTPSSHAGWTTRIYRFLHLGLWKLARGAEKSPSGSYLPLGRTADDARAVTAAVARLIALVNRYELIWLSLGCETELDFPSYLEGLALLAESERVADRIKNDLGVQISTPAEVVGGSYKKLFFLGAVEGEFPTFEQNILAPASPLSSLSLEERELSAQRFVFCRLVESSREVYISYPKRHADTELLPSQFLEQIDAGSGTEEAISAGAKRTCSFRERVLRLADNVRQATEGLELSSSVDKSSQVSERGDNLRRFVAQIAWLAASRHHRLACPLSEFDGNLAVGGIAHNFVDLVRERVFSAGELQELLDCPLRFFLRRVLGIQPPDRDESIFALQRGQLIHRILCQFMEKMRQGHWVPLRENPNAAKQTIVQTTWQELRKQFSDNPIRCAAFAIELLGEAALCASSSSSNQPDVALEIVEATLACRTGLAQQKGILVSFLEHETERNWQVSAKAKVTSGEPELLEWRFGLRDSSPGFDDPIPVDLGEKTVKLRGAIDRVDVQKISEDYGFAVIDYKTGTSCPTASDIKKHFRFIQLPLYAAAVKSAKDKLDASSVDLGECRLLAYYHLKRGETKFVAVSNPADVIDEILKRIDAKLQEVSDGHCYPLGASPADGKSVCDSFSWKCPYHPCCCRGSKDDLLVQKLRKHLRNTT